LYTSFAYSLARIEQLDIDNQNKSHLDLLKIFKNVGAKGDLALWALEWAWNPAESNLRYARS